MMISSLYNTTAYGANQAAIETHSYPGSNYSAIPQADGTTLAPNIDAQLETASVYVMPNWLVDETNEQYITRNSVAILAAIAQVIAGTLDAFILPNGSSDLILCKQIPGWVQDAPV